MFCPRCGKPVPAGAAFCPSCGSPTNAAAPTQAAGPQPPRPGGPAPRAAVPVAPVSANPVAAAALDQQRKNKIAMVGVGVAAMIAALFGLKAAGILKLGAEGPKPGLQARAQGPAPALQLPAKASPPSIAKVAERKQMPADVEEWLKHLERCEREKVVISGDQMAEAMVLMQKMQALGAGMGLMDPYDQSKDGEEDKDPGTYAKGKVMDFRPRWEQLLAFFNSKVPPEECKPLAADFNRALGEVPGMMGDIGDILNSVSNDPSAALQSMQKFKGGSYADVDRYFARADMKLSEICKKYDHNKWFNIKADVQGGSPLSMFGNMGGGATGFNPGQ